MTAPYTVDVLELADALRARPDGWAPADLERIGSALSFLPRFHRGYIGPATVNGCAGEAWMQADATETHLVVYGPWGTLLYKVSVPRAATVEGGPC